MANTAINEFTPDYAVHPGEILDETLDARGIKKVAFAKRCGLSDKTISQIISGVAPVTYNTAIQFERVLGVSAAVWSNLETNYRLHIAKDAAKRKLSKQSLLTKRFPVKDIVKRGMIATPYNKVDAVEKLFSFFGVGNADAFESYLNEMSAAFRSSKSFKSNPASVSAWLRLGDIYAEQIDIVPYDKNRLIANLGDIRKLTTQPPKIFEPKMKELCRTAGVALVFVSEFDKTYLSGATRWLNKDKALIMLSLRHKSDDHLWFSFFHEAAHVLLHGKRQVFLDELNMNNTPFEKEANEFSANFLIPEKEYTAFVRKEKFTKASVIDFANRIETAPGIVVGRLQHDKHIGYNWLNALKRKFTLVE